MSTNDTRVIESDGSPWKDEELLRELYVGEGLTQGEIGEQLGCSHRTIGNWMDEYGIDTRERPNAEYPTLQSRSALYELYVVEKKSTLDIAKDIGCVHQTVSEWLDRHEIQRRTGPALKYPQLADSDRLYHLYHEEQMSLREIASEVGCTSATVLRWLEEHNIDTREVGGQIDSILKDPETIEFLYVESGKSALELADRFNVSKSFVLDCVDRGGIEYRHRCGAEAGESHWNWKGGRETYYGPNWFSQRNKALDRDEWTCRRCGMENDEHKSEFGGHGLCVHHIRRFKSFEDYREANKLSNLLTVCIPCHAEVEGVPLDTRGLSNE